MLSRIRGGRREADLQWVLYRLSPGSLASTTGSSGEAGNPLREDPVPTKVLGLTIFLQVFQDEHASPVLETGYCITNAISLQVFL